MTATDMFLGITNSSATIFMCFKRIENFIYKANTLPWVTYNNLRANKTSWVIIGIIDHKNTIAIFHALVKILGGGGGGVLKIRRITLHYIGTVYASAVVSCRTLLQSLSIV